MQKEVSYLPHLQVHKCLYIHQFYFERPEDLSNLIKKPRSQQKQINNALKAVLQIDPCTAHGKSQCKNSLLLIVPKQIQSERTTGKEEKFQRS